MKINEYIGLKLFLREKSMIWEQYKEITFSSIKSGVGNIGQSSI